MHIVCLAFSRLLHHSHLSCRLWFVSPLVFSPESMTLSVGLVQNDLTFLRIRSKKHEIMVAPDKDYLLIVIQNPNAADDSK